MNCPQCGTAAGEKHKETCTFIEDLLDRVKPQSVDELKERIMVLERERAKLLTDWGKLKDDTLKIVAIMDSMKIEFSKIAIQRDEWRQLAARYRTMVNTHHSLQGKQNATDHGTASSPT